MNSIHPGKECPFTSAVLLVRHEDLAIVDRRVLREAGVRHIQVLSSGVETARLLRAGVESGKEMPEMILCHDQIADMTGDDFVRLIRLHPRLRAFPVVMAVSTNTIEVRKRARESGYSGLLPRPYTSADLVAQLEHAAQCQRETEAVLGTRDETDTAAFESGLAYFVRQALATSQNVDVVYRSGLLALRQQHWEEAITSLQRAVRLNPEGGEALIGLAAAWRGKGDWEKSGSLLQEALSVFVKNGAWNQVRTVSDRLIRENPTMPHPLHKAACRLLATGNYADAAQALICDLTSPEKAAEVGRTKVSAYVARGCLANPNPADAAEKLREQLTEAGYASLGSRLQAFVLEQIAGGGMNDSSAGVSAGASRWEERLLSSDPEDGALLLGTPLQTPSPPLKEKQKKTGPVKKGKAPVSPVITLLKEPEYSSTLGGFPLLRDALSVAKVTLGLFKARKKRS